MGIGQKIIDAMTWLADDLETNGVHVWCDPQPGEAHGGLCIKCRAVKGSPAGESPCEAEPPPGVG